MWRALVFRVAACFTTATLILILQISSYQYRFGIASLHHIAEQNHGTTYDTYLQPKLQKWSIGIKDRIYMAIADDGLEKKKSKRRSAASGVKTTSIASGGIVDPVNEDLPRSSKRKSDSSIEKIERGEIKLSKSDRDAIVQDIISKIYHENEKKASLDNSQDENDEASLNNKHKDLLNGVVRIYCTHSVPNFGD